MIQGKPGAGCREEPAPLVKDPAEIRLAMLGMLEDNGHPYSWSAIINGYDPRSRMGANADESWITLLNSASSC